MRKRLLFITLILVFSNLVFLSAEICNPGITLLSQDPYPVTPGEYVKLVFQISNIENPDCDDIKFNLIEKYPLIFDPGFDSTFEFNSGFYQRQYSSYVLIPYKVRVDSSAIEGDNPIETSIVFSDFTEFNEFNLSIEDSRADFEIHIDKYNYESKELTLEILNIADTDVEALRIEIPKQENIEITGSNIDIVGDLDSNEFTTADFLAIPNNGEIIVSLFYTDQEGTRRDIQKTLIYDSSYFIDSQESKSNNNLVFFIVGIIIVSILLWLFFRKKNKNIRRK